LFEKLLYKRYHHQRVHPVRKSNNDIMDSFKRSRSNALEKSLIDALNDTSLTRTFHKCCYDVLFDKVFSIAYGFSKENAKDITHDYFLKIFKKKIVRFELHASYLEKYLLKIAYNFCKDYLRRNKTKPLDNVSSNLDNYSKYLKGDMMSLNEINCFELEGYSFHLTKRQKKAMLMKIEGYLIKEITKEMKTTEGAVKNLIWRAKKIIVTKKGIHLR